MSTLKLDTLSNKAGTASVPSDTIVSGTAKAWVNFNGTGTVAIRRAFNVSSITDAALGTYIINFTNAMPDANYAISWSSTYAANSNTNWYTDRIFYNYTTTSVISYGGNGGSISDADILCVSVFS